MSNYNLARIKRDIEKYIPIIIQKEVKNEIFKVVTITGCDLAGDLGFCKVFFTALSDLDYKTLENEVNTAAPFIRAKLANIMKIRNTPELRFYYDKSVAHGNKINQIIKEIHEKDNEQ